MASMKTRALIPGPIRPHVALISASVVLVCVLHDGYAEHPLTQLAVAALVGLMVGLAGTLLWTSRSKEKDPAGGREET